MSDATPQTSAWRQLVSRRDLWWQFTIRAVEMKHRGSYLGMFWSVLNPLLMLGLYTVMFGLIFGGRFNAIPGETKLDYALGLFLGLIFFNILAETAAMAPILIVTNPNLVKRVVFPLEILPFSQLGSSVFNFLITYFLLLVGVASFGRGLTPAGLLWMPLIMLPHILLCAGIGLFLAALGVFFRDVQHFIQFLTQVMLYASAIFFSPNLVRQLPGAWMFLKWNPLLQTVNLARDALLWHAPVSLAALAYTYVAGVAVLLFGFWFFRRMQPAFADVI